MLLAAINCQLEVTNSLVNSKASKKLLTSALDGLTLSLTANYEINKGDEMQLDRSSRQNLPKVYAVLLTRPTNSCLEETCPNE